MIKLFVEGGGHSEALRSRCREGFRVFLENAGFKGRMPRIVACGGRREAYDRFSTACRSNETALLLIDSEDAVASDIFPWTYLANRPGDRFDCPENVTDDYCHLMVVCMETWFLADKDALSRFFGRGFNAHALPQHTSIEAVSKADIYNGLRQASSNCRTKAPYGKGEHSFKILKVIAPCRVTQASPWAKRFLETLKTIMDG